MSNDRTATIEARLRANFNPLELLVRDQSHLHAGHAGASDGRGHFDIKIVSDEFLGKSRIDRHRMIYDALHDLMVTDIHALRIRALTTSELD